jgi:hypothetical protein
MREANRPNAFTKGEIGRDENTVIDTVDGPTSSQYLMRHSEEGYEHRVVRGVPCVETGTMCAYSKSREHMKMQRASLSQGYP